MMEKGLIRYKQEWAGNGSGRTETDLLLQSRCALCHGFSNGCDVHRTRLFIDCHYGRRYKVITALLNLFMFTLASCPRIVKVAKIRRKNLVMKPPHQKESPFFTVETFPRLHPINVSAPGETL